MSLEGTVLTLFVFQDNLCILPSRLVRGSSQRWVCEVHMEQSKTNTESVSPFKVVQQRPCKISTDVDPIFLNSCPRKYRNHLCRFEKRQASLSRFRKRTKSMNFKQQAESTEAEVNARASILASTDCVFYDYHEWQHL